MMRNQIWCHLLATITFFGFIGCTTVTYPPPELQDNKYTNYEYQYSVEIPSGWEARTKSPKDLVLVMGQENSEIYKLVLVNQESGGMMGIMNERLNKKYENALKSSKGSLERWVQKSENQMKQTIDISRFDYDIKLSSLYSTQLKIDAGQNSFQPEEYLEMDIDMKFSLGTSRVKSKYFMYPCQGQKSCISILVVSSQPKDYEINNSAYEDFVSSFTVNVPIEQTE